MKVLFTSLAHHTHYYPLVPLAWALRTAGHEVRIASQPELTDTITQTGLTAVPVKWTIDDPVELEPLMLIHEEASAYVQGFDFTGQDGSQWTWEQLLALESTAVPALYGALNNDYMVDELVAFARAWQPDLVVWETFTFAGAIAARASGAAHARLVAGPDVSMRVRQQFLRQAAEQPPEHREDPTAEWLEWTLQRLGCVGHFTEDMVTGQWTIDSTPASSRLDLGLDTVPVRFVPYNGPSVVPNWLRVPTDRPRVCVTFGVSGSDLGEHTVRDVLQAMDGLDVEVIATLDETQLLQAGELPSNVRVVDFVPLNDLLPSCSAVVYHGGIGTKGTAELHGVPQLILVFGWDTAVMAEHVEKIGAGLAIPVSELTADAVRRKVLRLVNEPAFAEGARRLQEEALAEPSPNDIIGLLKKLTSEHRAG